MLNCGFVRERGRPYVDEQIDADLLEQRHKLGNRARSNAYREDCRHRMGLCTCLEIIYIK